MELSKNEQIALALTSAMISAQPKLAATEKTAKAVVNFFHVVLKEVTSHPPQA